MAQPLADVRDAMDALWETARNLERGIETSNELDAIEGRRFLTRMLSASLDTFVEWTDADRPHFQHSEGPHRKMFADCPDTDYLRAPIRLGDGRAYRVSGRVHPGSNYVGLLLYGRGGRVSHGLPDTDMGIDDDGRFSVIVTAEDGHEGVVLKGDGDENAVMVRQYYTDRSSEPAVDVQIELLGDLPPPQPLDVAWMAKRIERSRRMLEAIFQRTIQAQGMASAMARNSFIPIGGEQLFPTPDNAYQVCWYDLQPGQRMTVRGKLPTARYFSLCLYNTWMESLDYNRHTIHLNHKQLQTDIEGRFEVVLSNDDPGHANWLDIAGHHAGYLLARSLLPEGDAEPIQVEIA